MTELTPEAHDTAYLAGYEAGWASGLRATQEVTQDYRTLRDTSILLATVAYVAVAWIIWSNVRRYLDHAR